LFKHGPNTIDDFEDYVEAEMEFDLEPLEWSDELTLSAQKYMRTLDGCNIYEPQIFLSEWNSRFITEIATYDDHKRFVVYPERFNWNYVDEIIFDMLIDDFHENYDLRMALLSNEYN
jgi:hypothetical protein